MLQVFVIVHSGSLKYEIGNGIDLMIVYVLVSY